MQLIPRRQVSLHCPLDPEEALHRIAARLCAPALLRLRRPAHDFEGEVDAEGFRMVRIRWSTQRPFPRVEGRVARAAGGCALQLRMAPSDLGLAWFTLFVGLCASLGVISVVSALRHGAWEPLAALPVVAVFSAAARFFAFRGSEEEMDFAEACLREWLQAPASRPD